MYNGSPNSQDFFFQKKTRLSMRSFRTRLGTKTPLGPRRPCVPGSSSSLGEKQANVPPAVLNNHAGSTQKPRRGCQFSELFQPSLSQQQWQDACGALPSRACCLGGEDAFLATTMTTTTHMRLQQKAVLAYSKEFSACSPVGPEINKVSRL